MDAKPEEEYASLVRRIAMATVALRGHRQGIHETAVKRVVRNVIPAQQVASVLQTSIPRHSHESPASEPHTDLAVSFAILPDSEALQAVVLATRDGAAPNEVTTHRLTSSLTGAQVLDQADDRTPDDHHRDMYTIYRSFQDGTLTGPESMFKLSTFVVSHAYPKVAERLLIMRQLWMPWKHPMDLLSDARIYLERPLPWTVTVYRVEATIKLEACGVPRPERSVDGFFRYSVTRDDFPKWIDVFASAYRKLEDALLDESKKACKNPPSQGDILTATVQLIVLNGLLQSGFMEQLLEDRGFSHRVSEFDGSRSHHPCVAGYGCRHPVPRPLTQDQPKKRPIFIDSDACGLEDTEECDMSIDPECSLNGDASGCIESRGPEPDVASSTSQDSCACRQSTPEPEVPLGDESENDELDSEGQSGSREDINVSEEVAGADTLAVFPPSEHETRDLLPQVSDQQSTEVPPAAIETIIQTIVTPEDVRVDEESAAAHLGRHLKALVSPLASSRSLVLQLFNLKRPALPAIHYISVPASNPALSYPVSDDEREAFLDSVIELIPEYDNRRGWTRTRTARDWLAQRLLDTPVSGMSAAEMGYTPVKPNTNGSGVEAMPRVHPEAATMGLACMFFSGRGSEVAVRSEAEDEDSAVKGHTRTPRVDQDTHRALERTFLTHELAIGLPDARRCCWCCWRLRQWLNDCDPTGSSDRWHDPIMVHSWRPRSSSSRTAETGPRPPCPNFLLAGSNAIVLPWIPPAEGMGVPVEFLRVLLDELLGMLKNVAIEHADREMPEECVIA